MITAQQVVDIALAEARRLGRADETIVLVTDRIDASLRWANNTMTTNGESTNRTTTIISVVRQGNDARVGSVRSSSVNPSVITDLVAASQQAAATAPHARDAAPALPAADAPPDWDAPV
ncbi:MAG: TldD/PmbA family protein, partial [Mycobacterium sp.]